MTYKEAKEYCRILCEEINVLEVTVLSAATDKGNLRVYYKYAKDSLLEKGIVRLNGVDTKNERVFVAAVKRILSK